MCKQCDSSCVLSSVILPIKDASPLTNRHEHDLSAEHTLVCTEHVGNGTDTDRGELCHCACIDLRRPVIVNRRPTLKNESQPRPNFNETFWPAAGTRGEL